MAGAKETPRQRMIGMMYIVLTAMLALNVSSSILDAFVAIEENIQKANLTELFRGDERRQELQEVILDTSNPLKVKKAKLLEKAIRDIDAMTEKRIRMIDGLKLEILNACGEDTETVAAEKAIIKEKYDASKNALKPIRMNLEFVSGKDRYDESMYIMIGDDIKNPTGKGLELWKSFNDYRTELTEKIASTQIGGDDNPAFDKDYFFKAPRINAYESQAELKSKIQKAMDKSKVHEDDQTMIMEIYSSLTKVELSTVHDVNNVHWIGKTFDHAPSVAALASLSSMQKDILAARANALTLIRSRVTGADYNFNHIMGLAYGPEVVNQGEDFDVQVMMVAYDSDNQPEVSMNGENISDVSGGKGTIKLKGTNGTMNLTGTVSVKNRQGVKKSMKWEKSVMVMKPAGSIELPDLNVLYRGYDNKVNATASGFPQTILTGQNVSLTQSEGLYIAKPQGSGKTAYMTVSGRTADGRTVALKKVKYRVLNLPDPTMYWGGTKNGGKASPTASNIFANYGKSALIDAKFTILSWEVFIAGTDRSVKGTSNNVTGAHPFFRAAKKGTTVTYKCWVRGPSGIKRIITGVFTI
ncbi:MAG: gliding motility-associated protein GldM [Crocinitomicaceae bacterium]|jgi:gliding motility-associated protein GldM